MTTNVAVLLAEAQATALAVMVTGMITVRAALLVAVMTTTTVVEDIGRLHLRDVLLWMTTLLPEAATMTPTGPATTLLNLTSTAGRRTIAPLLRRYVKVAIHRGMVDIREMGMTAGAATGN